ncbi:hypothetical protein PVAG01_10341 [Phlyctema vagabunda]|uniref:Uncharacterized protein n=1 Tax=Phlyctema vagabunda TaxID=108571 RepID=A0ABR4P5M3_9HELO
MRVWPQLLKQSKLSMESRPYDTSAERPDQISFSSRVAEAGDDLPGWELVTQTSENESIRAEGVEGDGAMPRSRSSHASRVEHVSTTIREPLNSQTIRRWSWPLRFYREENGPSGSESPSTELSYAESANGALESAPFRAGSISDETIVDEEREVDSYFSGSSTGRSYGEGINAAHESALLQPDDEWGWDVEGSSGDSVLDDPDSPTRMSDIENEEPVPKSERRSSIQFFQDKKGRFSVEIVSRDSPVIDSHITWREAPVLGVSLGPPERWRAWEVPSSIRGSIPPWGWMLMQTIIPPPIIVRTRSCDYTFVHPIRIHCDQYFEDPYLKSTKARVANPHSPKTPSNLRYGRTFYYA